MQNENKLKIILDDKLLDSNFKLCFSLVYSIKSITGAHITKQIGRYYELSIEKNLILLDLQIPRIGNFNLSCGPEGIFIIDTLKNSKLNINVSDLIFEKPIKKKTYEDLKTKNFIFLEDGNVIIIMIIYHKSLLFLYHLESNESVEFNKHTYFLRCIYV